MTEKIRTTLDKICVEREESETITKGGIYIPETAEKKPTVGWITSMGPEVDDAQFHLGDKVFFDLYSGTNIKLEGVEYVIMKAKDVLCILEPADEVNLHAVSDAHIGEEDEQPAKENPL